MPEAAPAPAPGSEGTPSPAAPPTPAPPLEGEGGKKPPAPQPYRPQGLPDAWGGESDSGTIDKLFGIAKDFRDKIGQQGAVPKEASEYQFPLTDKSKPFLEVGDDDKVMPLFKSLAHEFKLTDKQVGFLPKLVEQLVDQGVLQPPVTPQQVYQELAPEGFKGTDEEARIEGAKRLATAQAWLNGLGGFDQPMKDEIAAMATTPAGVRVVEQLMKAGIQSSVNPGGGGPAGAVTREELNTRVADPRNQWGTPQYDESFARQTQEMFKRLHGDK